MGFLSKMAGTALTITLVVGAYQYLKTHQLIPGAGLLPELAAAREALSRVEHSGAAEHFSPAENLERLELDELREAAQRARKADRSLDIAIYAFTDRTIAGLLIHEADQGTTIRLYRDGEQYENEERNAERFQDHSITAMFRGHRNVHIRVKPPSRSDLIYLKDWSDGEKLREGSANWSPAALKRQDNDLRFTSNPEEVKLFEQTFQVMWNRTGNTVIQ
jgi:PLD-like domain